jgi:apolipoprotein N-acyltransferase
MDDRARRGGSEMTESDEGTAGSLPTAVAGLRRVREESRPHWVGLALAVVVGLVVSTVHWLGLVLGGVLVGLVAASLPRALLSGLGFGLIVLLVWWLTLVLSGEVGKVAATGELAGLGVVMALVAPVLGSLARGVV